MGPFEAQIFSVVFGVSGAVSALALILRFKLKKSELETRGSNDHHLGPAVDLIDEGSKLMRVGRVASHAFDRRALIGADLDAVGDVRCDEVEDAQHAAVSRDERLNAQQSSGQ